MTNCPLQEREEKKIDISKDNSSLVRQYLKRLVLKNVGCYITWDWNHNVAFIGLSEEELLNVIEPKTSKTKKYKTESDLSEIWLLIVSGPYLSQAMPMEKHILWKLNGYSKCKEQLSKSGFSKVFIYQYMFDTVFQYAHKRLGWEMIKCSNPGWCGYCPGQL